jgi:cation transport ATPase
LHFLKQPISLGVIVAVGMSLVETINHAEHAYFDSAVMLLFFLLCGRYLDRAMRARTRAVAGTRYRPANLCHLSCNPQGSGLS